MWLYFRFSSERVKLNCVTHSVKFEYLYLRKLSMIRNKVVSDKHYYSNRFTLRNIFLLCYSRFRLICIFNNYHCYRLQKHILRTRLLLENKLSFLICHCSLCVKSYIILLLFNTVEFITSCLIYMTIEFQKNWTQRMWRNKVVQSYFMSV